MNPAADTTMKITNQLRSFMGDLAVCTKFSHPGRISAVFP